MWNEDLAIPRTPLYKIGQKVVARRNVYNPLSGIDHPKGSEGEIIGRTIDSPFGFYYVDLNGDQFLTPVAPHAFDAGLEIKE